MFFRDVSKTPIIPVPSVVPIRYAIPNDRDRILRINRFCAAPIPELVLARALNDSYVHTRVAEWGGGIGGFAQYTVRDEFIELHGLAVAPGSRRRGVGRALADDARAALRRTERPRLAFVVPESNLGALLFWKACGIRATGVERGRFGRGCDGILFEYWAAGLAEQNCPTGRNDVP